MNTTILNTFKEAIQAHAAEIIALKKTYLIAKAMEENIKAEAEKIQEKILLAGNYLIDDEMWEIEKQCGATDKRITKPSNTFLMNEEIFNNDFLVKCYEEYKRQGIADERGKEHIPEAEYHDLRRKAEEQLIQIALLTFPEIPEKQAFKKACYHWKYRSNVLALMLKLDVNKK